MVVCINLGFGVILNDPLGASFFFKSVAVFNQNNGGEPEDGPVRRSRVWRPKVSGNKNSMGVAFRYYGNEMLK